MNDFPQIETCSHCKGTGKCSCSACRSLSTMGTGKSDAPHPAGTEPVEVLCNLCRGAGALIFKDGKATPWGSNKD